MLQLLLASLLMGNAVACPPVNQRQIRYTPDWTGQGDPLITDPWPYPTLPVEEWNIIGPYDAWKISIPD